MRVLGFLMMAALFLHSCKQEGVKEAELVDLGPENRRLNQVIEAGFRYENEVYLDIQLHDTLNLFSLGTRNTMFVRFTETQCLDCIDQIARVLNEYMPDKTREVVILASFESVRTLGLYLKRQKIDRFRYFNIDEYPELVGVESLDVPYIFQLNQGHLTNLWFPHYTLPHLNEAYVRYFSDRQR